MPLIDIQGVIWTVSILYVLGAVLTYFFEIDQSRLLDKEDVVKVPGLDKACADYLFLPHLK